MGHEMTDLDLTKLREIAKAATPGDWGFEYAGESHCGEPQCCSEYWDNRIWAGGMVIAESHCLSDGDAHHIATFDPPTAIALIDELERLREVVATVKAITDGTPECDKYDDKSPVTCGWKFDLQRIKEVMK